MAGRICPRCSQHVDERQAKTSPFCLRCGAPLGSMMGAPAATFTGKMPAQGGKSALPLILGIVGVVALLGIGAVVLLLVAVAERVPDPQPVATVEPSTGGPPKIEVPTAAASVSAAPTATGKVSGGKVPTATAPTVVPPFPTATVTRVDSGVLGPFPRAKAQLEVDRAGSNLASCKRATGPFGASSIRVDFEPDGRVGTLTRPPFAGTPVGSCISARFLSIRIGPFQGSTQSIEHQFIIQD